MTTGDRIKAARLEAGLTQKQLADKMGISYVNISQLENGRSKRGPTQETLQKIADALGIDPVIFFKNSVDDVLREADNQVANVEQQMQKSRLVTDATVALVYLGANGDHSTKLIEAFSVLNEVGQQKAVERVEELTEIPKYQKE